MLYGGASSKKKGSQTQSHAGKITQSHAGTIISGTERNTCDAVKPAVAHKSVATPSHAPPYSSDQTVVSKETWYVGTL